jgi:hypothetical protein
LCGQEKGRAADPNDVRTYIVESQMVEYRPKSSRDPFQAGQEEKAREQSDLHIDDVTIIGRIVANKKVFLLVVDPRQELVQLPIGYRFRNGELTAVTEAGATFATWDPALGPSSPAKRTVIKPFKREEVRR